MEKFVFTCFDLTLTCVSIITIQRKKYSVDTRGLGV